jgi:hypothetical protein
MKRSRWIVGLPAIVLAVLAITFVGGFVVGAARAVLGY